MIRHILTALLIFELLSPFHFTSAQQVDHPVLSRKIQEFVNDDNGNVPGGKKWALLVAGSRGYNNYRHQADVCHAYQILKSRGLSDENIIVFMYDDIASHPSNPRPGVIINHPDGDDVYKGVPKDYVGNETSVHNLINVILGNKQALTGGSGKVLDTGPEDHIFIYYADHGTVGLIGMPNDEFIYADNLNRVLKMKHEKKGYKLMVFYLEACEAGSMFQGLLQPNLNIYATTASNAIEDSYATYCPPDNRSIPHEFHTCLGDAYSVAWMEDSDKRKSSESLAQQYELVKKRTTRSHVMQYGDLCLSGHSVSHFIGAANHTCLQNTLTERDLAPYRVKVHQRDADLHYYKQKFHRSPKHSKTWLEAHKQLQSEIESRKLVDDNMQKISKILFGNQTVNAMLHTTRPEGQPLVDDWDCFRGLVETYKKNCGSLSSYGRKYTRAFANMCNAGITVNEMILATKAICW